MLQLKRGTFVSLLVAGAASLMVSCGGGRTGGKPGITEGGTGNEMFTPDVGPGGGREATGGKADAFQGCGLRTCASAGANCGPIGDGCGNVLNCGSCMAPQTCGGGGTPSVCGGSSGCTPKTCASLGYTCGPAGDGCGGMLNCGTCPAGQTCGGGGKPFQCGSSSATGDGGKATDGGGKVVTDAGTVCTPLTCADQKLACGMTTDGCGNSLNCGTCTAPQTCGGGGTPGVCGAPSCTPLTCATAGASCGMVGDGCGGVLSCGSCPTGELCGGAGVPNQCGGSSDAGVCTGLCLQQVKCEAGTTTVSGTVYAPTNCGTDAAPTGFCPTETCPSTGTCPDGSTCTPPVICPSSGRCPAGNRCRTGSVCVAGGQCLLQDHGDPLYGALVYVPNGPVAAFTQGASCSTCGAAASGSPLVSTTSAVDGTFTLSNVPVGSNIPIIFQLGRWRRKVEVNVAPCTNTALTPDQSRLARKQGEVYPEDNIPLIAFDTGSADPMECVLRKIGIDDSQFGVGCNTVSATCATSAAPRVQFYQDNGTSFNTGTTPPATTLYDNPSVLDQYDMAIFACVGSQVDKTQAEQQNVVDYASMGGRVFATHYSYVWLTSPNWAANPFTPTASWAVGGFPNPDPMPAYIDESFPKGSALAQWLQLVATGTGGATTLASSACGSLSTPAGTCTEIPVNQPRFDFTAVDTVTPTMSGTTTSQPQQWAFRNTNSATVATPPTAPYTPMHYTFNTPVGAPVASQCGRVLYSDFHVYASGGGATFPSECQPNAPMTPQEKLLEFMLFDLSNCVTADKPPPPMCSPMSCAVQGFNCGPEGDGCGNIQNCGSCPTGQTCGGGGKPGVCGGGCVPRTCADLGFNCGPAGDGCGGTLNCGTCTAPATCGGGGTPGVCGIGGDGATCVPLTCAGQGISCGPAGDGCGNLLSCGTCTAPQTCGGGGTPGVCGAPSCTPVTCAQFGYNCGTIGDGCGGTLNCGTCTAPQTCGGGGRANICGSLG